MSSEALAYSVPGVTCEHCRAAIVNEVGAVAGVESVSVDLDAKLVSVGGRDLNDADVRAAIDEAGYDILDVAP
jgi:copper chaperone CopZ